MNEINLKDEKIIRIADLLEQIKSVDEIIEVHKDDDNDVMLSQYHYRRNLFLKQIGELLVQLNIQPGDLIAA